MFKRMVLSLFFILCAAAAFSQQLTRVAVVDMQRIYNEFFQDSRGVKEFETRTTSVQNEINRMTLEIQELRTRHTNALAVNNQAEVNRLDSEISRRTETLRSYATARNAELDAERRNLQTIFFNNVRDEIRYVAESEAFHFIFDSNNSAGLLWFNSLFDLTDKVIQSLRLRSR